MTRVVDANVFLTAASSRAGFKELGTEALVGPPLLWPEVRSALHVALWRGIVSDKLAERVMVSLDSGPVKERRHRSLGRRAWGMASDLGWAKTYDAEYLALSVLLDAELLTFDQRLLRAAERVGVDASTPD